MLREDCARLALGGREIRNPRATTRSRFLHGSSPAEPEQSPGSLAHVLENRSRAADLGSVAGVTGRRHAATGHRARVLRMDRPRAGVVPTMCERPAVARWGEPIAIVRLLFAAFKLLQ